MATKKRKKKLRLRKPVRRALILIVTVIAAFTIFSSVRAISRSFSKPAPTPAPDLSEQQSGKTFELKKVPDGEQVATVMIDAGHGGYDGGNIGPDGQLEKDINLKFTNLFSKYLKEVNPRLNVIVLRDSDEVTWADNEIDDLTWRTSQQTEQNADYFISIHCNAFEDSSVSGTNAFVNKDDPIAMALAQKLLDDTHKAGWTETAEIVTTDTHPLQVVSMSKVHSILIETAYMTNPSDYALLNSDEDIDLFCKVLAQSVSDYIMANPDNPSYPEVWDKEYHAKLEEAQKKAAEAEAQAAQPADPAADPNAQETAAQPAEAAPAQ